MDCVEVVPLDEVLRRREGEAKRDNGRTRQELGGAAEEQTGWEIMGAPKTPFVRRTVREQLDRDEIGELFFRAAIERCPNSYIPKVPETPDAVLRPIRTSPLRAHKVTGE
jgi:hypothetical protein